jgi:AcrR family transcriptional regulator
LSQLCIHVEIIQVYNFSCTLISQSYNKVEGSEFALRVGRLDNREQHGSGNGSKSDVSDSFWQVPGAELQRKRWQGLRMSRRTFHRASEAERRKDLINATLDCISELGLQRATVREVAARAGVTPGLIRHYFSSKDLMLQAAYREVMAGMTSAVSAAADEGQTSACARLHDFIVANLTPPVADGRALSLWAAFISHVRVDPAFAEIHRESYLAFRSALEILVADVLAEAGEAPDANRCRELSISINGVIDGLWLEGTLVGDLFSDTPLPGIAIRSVEALLGGIRLAPRNQQT